MFFLVVWGLIVGNLYKTYFFSKELSLCYKIKIFIFYIFAAWWGKPLIFKTWILWSNRIYSLKYLSSTTFSCKDVGIWKFKFVADAISYKVFLNFPIHYYKLSKKIVPQLKVGEYKKCGGSCTAVAMIERYS